MKNLFANKHDLEAAQSQIVSLETDLTALQNELTESQSISASHVESLATLQAEKADALSSLENLTVRFEASQAKIAELENKVIEAEQSATQKAISILAEQGHAPLEIVESANANTNTKTLTEFNSLNHMQRNAFIREGGKIN
jgi:predicted  nucleic acid-binding Zn-ribbon protein